MSRDYKKPSRQSTPKKRGGSTLTGVVVGLFIGLALAIGVAAYIYLAPSPFASRTKPAKPDETVPTPAKATTNTPKTADKAPEAGKTAEKPRFDFYTILPGSEDSAAREMKQAGKQVVDSHDGQDSYFLQVGSFQAASEADNLKAKLALLGVEAAIQTANLPDKGAWHRVRVGPFNNLDDLNRTRTLLGQNGISASLVKVRDGAPQ